MVDMCTASPGKVDTFEVLSAQQPMLHNRLAGPCDMVQSGFLGSTLDTAHNPDFHTTVSLANNEDLPEGLGNRPVYPGKGPGEHQEVSLVT